MQQQNDTYEVIDGEYYIDETGSPQPDRRAEMPPIIHGTILMPAPEPIAKEGQFFVDSNGNISDDRRGS